MIEILISLLVALIVIGIVFYLLTLLLDLIPMDPRFAQIAKVVLLLIAVLILISRLLPLAGVSHL